jgi:MtN3 and saliva related transmembrane protein
MPPYLTDSIGMMAGVLTTLCWLPQTILILRTRDARAISLATQSTFACGVALWLAYGLLIGSWPVIIANALTLVLVSAIVVLKLLHG